MDKHNERARDLVRNACYFHPVDFHKMQEAIAAALRSTAKEAAEKATAAERARCAEVARTFAEVNLEMAGDSILADPILSGERLTEAAIQKSDSLVIDGCIHSSMYHAANNIATAIEKECNVSV